MKKKLNLSVETLLALSDASTQDVVGGWLTDGCPVRVITHFIRCDSNTQTLPGTRNCPR